MRRNLKEIVTEIISTNLEARDNDRLLCTEIWKKEMAENDYKDFFVAYANKNLTTQESIGRVRRKLQQEIPSLRGNLYNKRHQEAVSYREDIDSKIEKMSAKLEKKKKKKDKKKKKKK